MATNGFFVFGYAARPPRIREVNGTLVANIRVGEKRFRRRGGQSIEYTEWFDGELWGNQRAQAIADMVETGDELFLDGELSKRTYTDDENRERVALEIRIDNWRLLSKKRDRNAARAARNADRDARPGANEAAPAANGRTAEPSGEAAPAPQDPPPSGEAANPASTAAGDDPASAKGEFF